MSGKRIDYPERFMNILRMHRAYVEVRRPAYDPFEFGYDFVGYGTFLGAWYPIAPYTFIASTEEAS